MFYYNYSSPLIGQKKTYVCGVYIYEFGHMSSNNTCQFQVLFRQWYLRSIFKSQCSDNITQMQQQSYEDSVERCLMG